MRRVLEFERVTKEYRGWRGNMVRALDDFSLSVEPGEIFGFLGPNGAGKTTAIHLALGFMRPTSGSGRMLGEPFGHAPTRRRVGFLAEHVALYHRPAGKLVELYGALNGMRGDELKRSSRQALDRVGLAEVAQRNAGRFSRGMLQRVGLAQALVNDPELLILDEPTSALDPAARVAVRELLLNAKRQGKTIFLSSHLLSEIELICDRVAFVHRGRVVRSGRTHELLERRECYEIAARGVEASVVGGALVQGLVHFTVAAREQRSAMEKVWAAGGEVVSVHPARRTLEEVFLELTREEKAR